METLKTQYFRMIEKKKHSIEYYKLHYYKTIKICRWIKYILAIIGTGSLAGFYFIPKWQNILVFIVALSQIFSAVEPHLPYEKRCRDLDKQIYVLEAILIDIESNWLKVYVGMFNELQIVDLIRKYEHRWNTERNDNLNSNDIPPNEKFSDLAGKITHAYLIEKYPEVTNER